MADVDGGARFFELNTRLIAEGLMSEDISEGDPFERIDPPSEWEEYAVVTVTPEVNELYLYSLDDDNEWYRSTSPFGRPLAHPIALLQLGTRPLLRQFPVSIPKGESSLHAKMDVEYLGPVFLDLPYSMEGRLAEKYARRGRRYLVTEGRFTGDDGVEVVRFRHTRMVGREPEV
jgi:acyl dehydratase